MFAFVMFFNEGVFQPGRIFPDLFCQIGHLCDGLQHGTVVDRLFRGLAPCEGSVIAHEDHLHILVGEPFGLERIHDLKARLVFVVAFYHRIVHGWRAGDVYRAMVGVRGAEDRDIPLCMGPGSGVGGVGVYDAADVFPVFVQHGVREGVGGRTELAFYGLPVQIDNDHFIGGQVVIWHSAGFDGEDAQLAVDGADVAESKKDQPELW